MRSIMFLTLAGIICAWVIRRRKNRRSINNDESHLYGVMGLGVAPEDPKTD
ncbi:MAG: hypothetical protein K2W82_17765 [Candidatus Obscuribacterales bacterium]|nr:hypothetical protein [Candidatus Obscuribacterales bacterium]